MKSQRKRIIRGIALLAAILLFPAFAIGAGAVERGLREQYTYETKEERSERIAKQALEAKAEEDEERKRLSEEQDYSDQDASALYGGFDSMEEYNESRKADTLTEEEILAGYIIKDGYKLSLEEQKGDPGEDEIKVGGVAASKTTGSVTFIGSVPDKIHEPIYVQVTNTNTYDTFKIELYEANRFADTVNLPGGIYIIANAGLSADTEGRFYGSSKQFEVDRGSSQTVEFSVYDAALEYEEMMAGYPATRAEPMDTEEEVAVSEVVMEEVIVEQEEHYSILNPEPLGNRRRTQTTSTWNIVLSTVLFTVIPIFAAGFFYIKVRGSRRGFDE